LTVVTAAVLNKSPPRLPAPTQKDSHDVLLLLIILVVVLPGGHVVHALAPVVSVYVPKEQAVHMAAINAPLSDEYVPAAQSVQADFPDTALNFPR
jgi:hypothetical protein